MKRAIVPKERPRNLSHSCGKHHRHSGSCHFELLRAGELVASKYQMPNAQPVAYSLTPNRADRHSILSHHRKTESAVLPVASVFLDQLIQALRRPIIQRLVCELLQELPHQGIKLFREWAYQFEITRHIHTVPPSTLLLCPRRPQRPRSPSPAFRTNLRDLLVHHPWP